MVRKLDLGQAWNEALALLGRHRDLTLIVAAVFFFLPNAISTVALPSSTELQAQLAAGDSGDPEAMMAALTGFYEQIWPAMVAIGLLQIVGMLTLLVLWTRRTSPTVGEALAFGLKGFLPLIGAQILSTLIVIAAVFLLIVIGALINEAIAVLMGLLGLLLAIYLWVKFSLVAPVVAAEGVLNPVRILQRSFRATKGNSLRIFAFFLLLIICAIVISLLVSMVGSIFGLAGEDVGLFASAIIGALVSMVLTTIYTGVLAAIHRQLAGTNTADLVDTFD